MTSSSSTKYTTLSYRKLESSKHMGRQVARTGFLLVRSSAVDPLLAITLSDENITDKFSRIGRAVLIEWSLAALIAKTDETLPANMIGRHRAYVFEEQKLLLHGIDFQKKIQYVKKVYV